MGKLSAMYSGLGDGFKLGWQAFQKERSIYGKTPALAGLANTQVLRSPQNQLRCRRTPSRGWLMPSTKLKAYRIPSRVMMGSDELVKHITMRGEAAAMGVRRGIEEGGMGQDWTGYKDFQQYIDQRDWDGVRWPPAQQ